MSQARSQATAVVLLLYHFVDAAHRLVRRLCLAEALNHHTQSQREQLWVHRFLDKAGGSQMHAHLVHGNGQGVVELYGDVAATVLRQLKVHFLLE